jgi:hypothetical protein
LEERIPVVEIPTYTIVVEFIRVLEGQRKNPRNPETPTNFSAFVRL